MENDTDNASQTERIYIRSNQIFKMFAIVVGTATALLAFTASYIIHNVDGAIRDASESAANAREIARENTANIASLTTIVSVIAKAGEHKSEVIGECLETTKIHNVTSEQAHENCRHRITILEEQVQHNNMLLDKVDNFLFRGRISD